MLARLKRKTLSRYHKMCAPYQIWLILEICFELCEQSKKTIGCQDIFLRIFTEGLLPVGQKICFDFNQWGLLIFPPCSFISDFCSVNCFGKLDDDSKYKQIACNTNIATKKNNSLNALLHFLHGKCKTQGDTINYCYKTRSTSKQVTSYWHGFISYRYKDHSNWLSFSRW